MTRWPKLSPRAGAIILAWTALALVFTPQAILLNMGRPEPLPHWQAIARSAQIFLMWALLTPVAIAGLQRFPPAGARQRLNIAINVAIGTGLFLLHMIILVVCLLPQLHEPVPLSDVVRSVAISVGATDVLLCGAMYAAAIALLHLDERRRVERALVDARLTALRAQLQPHFLFNTLNALAELLHRDPPLAEALLLRLSALLRRSLDDSDAATIPLGEELAFLDDYLSIQQALLGDRLRVERDISPDTLHWPVPPLMLQPLVENALRHGIAPRRAGGILRLAAHREGGRLSIRIENDVEPGLRDEGTGIGLRNTRERLAAQYADATLVLDESIPGRFRVDLALPA